MIEMKLKGGYTIRTLDALNIVLEQTNTVSNPKSKSYGKEVTRRLGYFGSLKSALMAYATHRLNSTDISAVGVPEVAEALRSIQDTIAKAVEEEH